MLYLVCQSHFSHCSCFIIACLLLIIMNAFPINRCFDAKNACYQDKQDQRGRKKRSINPSTLFHQKNPSRLLNILSEASVRV